MGLGMQVDPARKMVWVQAVESLVPLLRMVQVAAAVDLVVLEVLDRARVLVEQEVERMAQQLSPVILVQAAAVRRSIVIRSTAAQVAER